MQASLCGLTACLQDEDADSSGRHVFPVPLKEVSITAEVRGVAMAITARLVYENTLDSPIECLLIVPVSETDALFRLEAEIGGRKIRGECRNRESAIEIYSASVDASYNGVLLENQLQRPDAVRVWFGTLKPKATVVITVGVAQLLSREPEGGIFTLKVPEVFNPLHVTDFDPADFCNKIVPPENGRCYVAVTTAPYSMTFEAKINLGISSRIADIAPGAPSDEINVNFTENNKTATVTLTSTFVADHNFDLLITPAEPTKPQVYFEPGISAKVEGCKWLAFHAVCAWFDPQDHANSLCCVKSYRDTFWFVVNCSETMEGARMEAVKASLILLVKSLPIGSKFNIVTFGSSYNCLFPNKAVACSEQNILAAVKFIHAMKTDAGGRELLEPLRFIHSQGKKSNKTHHCNKNEFIFLLIDGEVGNANEVLALAGRHASTTRFFTLGIGDAVSSALLDGLARVSNGITYYVREPVAERMNEKVISLLKFALHPTTDNIKFEWSFTGGYRIARLIPANLSTRTYEGCPIRQFTLVENQVGNGVDGSSTITADLKGENQSTTFQTNFVCPPTSLSVADDPMPLHRLAAKLRLAELSNDALCSGLVIETLRKEAVAISVATSVISDFTALIAVDCETGSPLKRHSPIFAIPESNVGYYVDDDGTAYHFARQRTTVSTGNTADRMKRVLTLATLACQCHVAPVEDDILTNGVGKGTMEGLIMAQRINGSWKLSPRLFGRYFGTNVIRSVSDLRHQCIDCFAKIRPPTTFSISDDFIATALAVTILRHQFSAKRSEFELVDQKATTYLFGVASKTTYGDFTASQLTQFINSAVALFRL